ncbi:uncharacterized protein A4U43_C06F3080 [Asparagus officinalis]|uniref:Sodium/calcium exchanger membrane region domain-containing protein n=1 Tax=Asparagus officinalis TaxID=4686 RepID=A0A5P1EJR8_ASPOF|nr:uncharacterized protein A4U43_C06F3080 [Asparagus officinalis]
MELKPVGEESTQLSYLRINMGSAGEDNDLELEMQALANHLPATRKRYASDILHIGAYSDFPESFSLGRTVRRILTSISIVMLSTKINLLLPFGPLSIVLHYLTKKHGLVFFFSLIGIAPLAERLGYATEQLAFYTGPTVGGLLNATFGNATEMIIAIYALQNGMIRVVQQSLLGSILSNMLLVLGNCCCKLRIAADGCNGANVSSRASLYTFRGAVWKVGGCIMLVAYASYLVFQLKSHRNLYNPIDSEDRPNEDDSDEEEVPEVTLWEALVWLAVLTIWISVLSEYLVNAIEGASDSLNLPVAFISVILLPIVGNAAEHASAIMFAMKNKLDITLGVAIGSSTQIAMFVIPFCVVVGWIMGKPMDLNFQLFETATLFITVLVVAFMLQEGTANYLKGLMLILCYLIVAASFFVHVDPTTSDD